MFKKVVLATTIIMCSPIMIGLLGSLLAALPKLMVLAVYAVGFLLFLIARIINFNKGIWVLFGSGGMGPNCRFLYRTGYAFMIFAVALSASLLIMQRI